MRAEKRLGFSLMEMMVVLLIVAIVAAASAPMVTKKMMRNAGTGDSPWVFTGDRDNIAFLPANSQVLIGAAQAPDDGARESKLYIGGREDWSHVRFGNKDNTASIGITADPGTEVAEGVFEDSKNGRIGISNVNLPNNTIAFGSKQERLAQDSILIGNRVNVLPGSFGWYQNSIAIGHRAIAGYRGIAIGNHWYYAGTGDLDITQANRDAVAIGSLAKAQDNSVSIGESALSYNNACVAIGLGAQASIQNTGDIGENSIAIGSSAQALGSQSIAIGLQANWSYENNNNSNTGSIAIGSGSDATKIQSIAIGQNASSTGENAIAIGGGYTQASNPLKAAKATAKNSVAIGVGAVADQENQIVLGNSNSVVYIPGKLIVGDRCFLGANISGSSVAVAGHWGNGGVRRFIGDRSNDVHFDVVDDPNYEAGAGYTGALNYISDRRLKNVGEKYTAGLEELKKLDLFHYTFKKDENKTPHVGVMAQDLQKVFPDAVTEGDDGYLRIRMEDMFYAVINAVKELDNKIVEIADNVNTILEDLTKLKSTVEAQQKTIDELKTQNEQLQKMNEDILKRLEKVEKKASKSKE